MKAVIMAGGFGTRIQPLTSSLPKPMIPVLNRPMMEYAIRALKDVGITEIVILLYFMPDVIRNYFGDGSNFGVKIDYCLPNDDYGTAGAVKKAEHLLNERFIVISGDLITDFDLNEIVGFHDTHGAFATLALTSVEDPLQFGVVMTDHTGKILKFLEKPGWGEVFSDTINTGIYVMEPDSLKYIPSDKPFDFSKDLFPLLMLNNQPLYGYKAKGYWRDVGNPDSYRQTCLEIMEDKIKIACPGTEISYGHGVLFSEDNTRYEDVSIMDKVVTGKNVTLGKGVKLNNCIIGNNVVIKANASIRDSIIWDDVVIGAGASINYSVICNSVVLGQNVSCDKGCIIAENTEVGNYVIFDKDIMVWPNKQIEDHSILSSNLIWGDKWKRSIFEGGKVTARTNVELSADLSAKLGCALGSILPKGGVVLVSRDYNRASRMLKRSFLGGLVSAGIETVDIRMSSMPVLKSAMRADKDVAGVYFKQYPADPNQTEIQFLDSDGLPLDPNTEKNIERLFYRENFRRVPHDEIGNIIERPQINDAYMKRFLSHFDKKIFSQRQMKVVADLLNGTTDEIFPSLLNRLGIDSVVLNAYQDEHKLARTMSIMERNVETVNTIVTTLKADLGLFVSPHAERLSVTTDKGEYLAPENLLLVMLLLMDMTAEKHLKVYIPAAAPTVLDSMLKKTQIIRGKFVGLKPNFIRDFDMVANLETEFIFPHHSLGPDGMYTAVKIMEMLQRLKMNISDVVAQIPVFHYAYNAINCPTDKKGYLMRKMSEEGMSGGEASYVDGVKILFADKGWVLMLPDQYTPNIHLFVEANSKENMEALSRDFQGKIHEWIEDIAV